MFQWTKRVGRSYIVKDYRDVHGKFVAKINVYVFETVTYFTSFVRVFLRSGHWKISWYIDWLFDILLTKKKKKKKKNYYILIIRHNGKKIGNFTVHFYGNF